MRTLGRPSHRLKGCRPARMTTRSGEFGGRAQDKTPNPLPDLFVCKNMRDKTQTRLRTDQGTLLGCLDPHPPPVRLNTHRLRHDRNQASRAGPKANYPRGTPVTPNLSAPPCLPNFNKPSPLTSPGARTAVSPAHSFLREAPRKTG